MDAPDRKRVGRPPLVENRREAILETAARLFGEVGYEKCSMQDISEAAEISKGALYHYFRTKQEIYDAIFLGTLRRMIEEVGGAIDATADARTRLVQYFTGHAGYFDAHYWDFNATMLGLAGIGSPAMRQEAVELRDRYEGMLRAIVRHGVETGEFGTDDPRTVSLAALSMLNWMPRWYRRDGSRPAGEIAAQFAELLIGGLAPRN